MLCSDISKAAALFCANYPCKGGSDTPNVLQALLKVWLGIQNTDHDSLVTARAHSKGKLPKMPSDKENLHRTLDSIFVQPWKTWPC